jgi:hypothetical protein
MTQCLKLTRTIMAVGKQGVGKTFVKIEACRLLEFDYIGICTALEDPSSIRGYPSRGENGRATHCLFDGIARAMDAKKKTLLDFDDIGHGSESTMRSVLRLFQFRMIDERKLPDHVVLSASTNDVGPGMGVYGMLAPLKNRFHSIITVEEHIDDTVGYGMVNNWPFDLLAYLRNNPAALHDCKPVKNMMPDGSTPRGWDYAAQWVNAGIVDPEVIAGAVGKGRATEYLSFRALINELPDVDRCIMDPTGSPVPENPSARFMIAMALATKMNAGNFGQIRKYLDRLPAMFRAFSIKDAFRCENEKRQAKLLPEGYRQISMSKDFTAWVASKDGKDVMSAAGAD